jgi:uncharacterized protein YoxC
MPFLPYIFATALVVLTIVLTAVGIQMVMVLMEMRKTLQKVNTTLDVAEAKIEAITMPIQKLGGMASGLATGLKVFEGFVGWINREKESKKA